MGTAKWGMLRAGRNKKQVHEKVKKIKSQGPEARTAGAVRRGSRKTEECHGHQQVCWLRITKGMPVGPHGRGGNGVCSRQAKGGSCWNRQHCLALAWRKTLWLMGGLHFVC